MCHFYKEKREKRNENWKRNIQSGKHHNTRRKEKLQIPRYVFSLSFIFIPDCLIMCRHDQTIRNKEKNQKEISQKCKETTRNQNLQQELNQRNRYLGCLFCKILWALLKLDKRGAVDRRMRKTNDVQNLHPRDDDMLQEKENKENSKVLRILSMQTQRICKRNKERPIRVANKSKNKNNMKVNRKTNIF